MVNSVKNINDKIHSSMPKVIQNCSDFEGTFNRFKDKISSLEHLSEDIIKHLEGGDIDNQEVNSKLWHDLNNIHHQVRILASYNARNIKNTIEELEELFKMLLESRPKKN